MTDLVCRALMDKNITISVAESFTGGGISSELVAHPGISGVFLCGTVAYTDEAKICRLNVARSIIETYGAVSAECAAAMAEGARSIMGSDIGLSSTGFAGPGGGTAEAPVGTAFIGFADSKHSYAVRYTFAGSREDITRQGIEAAFSVLWQELRKS